MSKYIVYVDASVRICFGVEADNITDARQFGWDYAGHGDVLEVYQVEAVDALEETNR